MQKKFNYIANFAYQNIILINYLKKAIKTFDGAKNKDKFTSEQKQLGLDFIKFSIKNIDIQIDEEKKNIIMDYSKSQSVILNSNITFEEISNLIDKYIYPEMISILKQIDKNMSHSSSFRLLIMMSFHSIISNIEISVNILMKLKQLYINENKNLLEKYKADINASEYEENQNKILEENSLINENIKLKNLIKDFTFKEKKCSEKINELSTKIEELENIKLIVENKLKSSEENLTKSKEEIEEVKNQNDNLKRKNIKTQFSLLAEVAANLKYEDKYKASNKLNFDLIQMIIGSHEREEGWRNNIKTLEEKLSKNNLELDKTKSEMNALNSKLEMQNEKIKLNNLMFMNKQNDFEIEKINFEKQIQNLKSNNNLIEKNYDEEKEKRRNLEKSFRKLEKNYDEEKAKRINLEKSFREEKEERKKLEQDFKAEKSKLIKEICTLKEALENELKVQLPNMIKMEIEKYQSKKP